LGFSTGIPDIYIMCGISGIFYSNPSGDSEESQHYLLERIKKMSDSLEHRGPDGEGFWIHPKGHGGFGHRRLAIIDLSREAAQPMHYLKRYTIVYNGEIYNYIELRDLLTAKGYGFRSQSDTEVLLAAYDCYGEGCLQYFDGMFAFAIWDEQEQILFMARDRFGEKPLYYSFNEKEFCFSSERKALWAAGLQKKINQPLLLNYLVLGYTQTPLDKTITFHQDVFSLPPSHYIKLDNRSFRFEMHSYWDCDKETKIEITEADAIKKFKELLMVSVKRRLRSDVPLGTSLSGGLDSSSIASLLFRVKGGNLPLQTFSSIFPGFEKDESPFIELVAGKFGMDNHQVIPDAEDMIDQFEKLCYYQEEPFGSSSVYAQYKVFQLAAQNNVKVLLDGQGADEMLAGYHKYIHWYLQELFRTRPLFMFNELKALKRNKIPFQWGWKNYAAALFPAQAAIHLEKKESRRLLHFPDLTEAFKELYTDRQSLFKPLVIKLNDILYFNSFQSGLEELLRYADRNSMAHGRELRLPFLNHELAAFVFSLPSHFKIHDGWTKYILRKTMEDQLPREIVWRKDKTGFEPPQQTWMQNNRVQEYIMEAKRKLVKENVLKASVLQKKIQPRDAFAADNFDWRYLVAATCMDKRDSS
jgi:asparagine synthase (glutamine-hydrolysing)